MGSRHHTGYKRGSKGSHPFQVFMCVHVNCTQGKKECACVEAAEVCNITEGCVRKISFSTSLCTLLCVLAWSCTSQIEWFFRQCKTLPGKMLEHRIKQKCKQRMPPFTVLVQQRDGLEPHLCWFWPWSSTTAQSFSVMAWWLSQNWSINSYLYNNTLTTLFCPFSEPNLCLQFLNVTRHSS